MTDISKLSSRYNVRRLDEKDCDEVFALCRKNTLYYRYCPPFVTKRRIIDEMKALPPGKEAFDKYYLGYYDGDKLIAVMDLIMAYPDGQTAFIGFFMTDISVQGRGVGTGIIDELCAFLSGYGYSGVRLCRVKGNPQAEHFWNKNGFAETGITSETENYTLIVAQRNL